MKGVRNPLSQRAIEIVQCAISLLHRETGEQRLETQMVFFVHHDAERLAAIHDNGAAHAFRSVFATDEMPLDQDLLFQRRKILQQF